MTLPFLSTIVDTAGTSPCVSWADPLATTSEARLDISPIPPASGNIRAVATTLANKQHPASLRTVRTAGGRSDMRTRLAAPGHLATASADPHASHSVTSELTCGVGKKFSFPSRVSHRGEVRGVPLGIMLFRKTARPSQKKRYQTVAQLPCDHLT